ncbi:MAG: sodium:proton antiporter [Paludibacteraceae bacterium]|nr:sodium:proton antiporter [Paludibacteraceae bacterium]
MEETFMMPALWMIPFGIMLLSIAVGPLIAPKLWESNLTKLIVSIVLGIPVVVFMLVKGLSGELINTVFFDYVPFIILLLALFVITGGIHLSGDIKAKPWVNTLFLAVGFVLASLMGTTGAAMLLIRPVLATNQQRQYKIHTVLFFIALVANCGGLMTPLGDPPLFMLFLRGASFTWFSTMWMEWLFTGSILLLLYFMADCWYYYKKESWVALSADTREIEPLRITGKLNFVWLIGIVASVAFINQGLIPAMGAEDAPIYLKYLREIAMLIFMGLSLLTTSKKTRYEDNKYTWAPIIEVAALFIGIFVTMAPALIYLEQNAARLGFNHVWQFYYSTGLLSSFLDNTPTAVAFHSMALGLPESVAAAAAGIVDGELNGVTFVAGVPEMMLKAISIGAVFFGSMTYIGNGPNFMVKAIAEESGIKMPSFFGYMIKFSLIILLPIYILGQVLFL